MVAPPRAVIGVDLGRHALKSVLLQRKGENRFGITHFACRRLAGPVDTAEALSGELRALFKDMGGSAKLCAVAVSSPDALIRIIEQPQTPTQLLREALRLNGMAYLNQDCRRWVLDCAEIASAESVSGEAGAGGKAKYLVGGAPRDEVARVDDAFSKAGQHIGWLPLAPISILNAFEFACRETFQNGAFFLVDIGHMTSTLMVGMKGELVLVRSIDCGGSLVLETLRSLTGEPHEAVLQALESEDELMVENTRMALGILAREISSSFGFFESNHEANIDRIYVSGAPAKSPAILKVLGEEVERPCTAWSAVARCEVGVAQARIPAFEASALDLHVACGAAAEALEAL
jgi:Tfp pilus assembly PilM family ATPase